MVTIKITNKAWSNQSQRLALAAARIVLTSFPAEREAQGPGKRNRKCNQSHRALWGQEEPSRGCSSESMSLRGTWACLHVSFSTSTEDRSYILGQHIFFSCFLNNRQFFFSSFWGFCLLSCGSLGLVHFLPPIIWIQAVLLCLLLKDGDLVKYPKSIYLF